MKREFFISKTDLLERFEKFVSPYEIKPENRMLITGLRDLIGKSEVHISADVESNMYTYHLPKKAKAMFGTTRMPFELMGEDGEAK